MTIKFTKGTVFPFVGHQDRINRYKENMKMFRGEFKDIFNKYNMNPNGSLYVSLNLAGVICKKSADMLLGEAVQVSAGKKDESEEQAALDRIVSSNYLNIVNYESALTNCIKGDSFYKVRYGQEWNGQLAVEQDMPRVLIENLQAEYVFPETHPTDSRKIITYHICVPVYSAEEDAWYLDVESHSAGKVLYHKYALTVSQTDGYGEPEKYVIGKQIGSALEEATGVSMPLVVHVPNIATDSWMGQDDLSEHKSLFDEINNRLSQIAAILDKHADPAMAIPYGLLDVDENGNPIFHVAREKVFELMGKDDMVPQYITWNGQLQHAYSELDRLIDNLLIAAEIPAVAVGKRDSGTSGNTGLAIKFRMSPLLAKINRKRQYYDKALKQVLILSQELEKIANKELQYETTMPVLRFNDGLPRDTMTETQTVAIRVGNGTLSRKSAIMQLDNKTEEQAIAELERVLSEQEEFSELSETIETEIHQEEDADDSEQEADN